MTPPASGPAPEDVPVAGTGTGGTGTGDADPGDADPAAAPRPSADAPLPPLSIAQSLGALALAVVAGLVCAVLFLASPLIGREAATLVYYVAFMGASVAIAARIRRLPLRPASFDLALPGPATAALLALGSVTLLMGILGPIVSAIPMSGQMEEAVLDMLSQTGPLTFLYFVVAAPVLEEFLFRGILLDGLLRRYRPWTAIWVSSLLFGAFHLNPWQLVLGLGIGLYAGWVYVRSRGLWACVLIHMAANGAAFVARLLIDVEEMPEQETGWIESYGGIVPMAAFVTGSAVVLALCVRALGRRLAPSSPGATWSSDAPRGHGTSS